MILDLHSHSIKSDDGRAKVDNYCKWIHAKNIPIDGFVLTEHRQFDFESDYSGLGRDYGLVILKASEVETEYGHVLVFGVTEGLIHEFDFSSVRIPLATVLASSEKLGAVAVPCHPGRPRVGMHAHLEEYGVPEGVRIVETFNGGSRNNEDEIAQEMAGRLNYLGIGGSDAHIVSHIGRCATDFRGDIRTVEDLVDALQGDEFEAVTFKK